MLGGYMSIANATGILLR